MLHLINTLVALTSSFNGSLGSSKVKVTRRPRTRVVGCPIRELNGEVDEGWALHLESLDARPSGDLSSSYARATRDRLRYSSWLFRKMDAVAAKNEDTSWFEEEIERVQHADDSGLNRWGTREEVGDVEYGIFDEVRELETGCNGYLDLLDAAEEGRDLCDVREVCFSDRVEARQYAVNTKKAFAAGDHTREVIGYEIRQGLEPFVVFVLESDGNWDHRRGLRDARDWVVTLALLTISKATSKQELYRCVAAAKRYSNDMQLVNKGKLTDGNRKVSCGLNYVRFAMVMNAIADRGAELGFGGFQTYEVKEFAPRKAADGDMFAHGARCGEHVALKVEDDQATEESLWEDLEGSWKPSAACKASLNAAGPLGYKSHNQLAEEHAAWLRGDSISRVA